MSRRKVAEFVRLQAGILTSSATASLEPLYCIGSLFVVVAVRETERSGTVKDSIMTRQRLLHRIPLSRRHGAALMEYALLVSLIAVVLLVSVKLFGLFVVALFVSNNSGLTINP